MRPQTSVPERPVVEAVIAACSTVGFGVGDGQAPTPIVYPYTVVYALDPAERSGPMVDGQADVTHTIQVTSVGITPEQAQSLADDVDVRLKAGVDVEGRTVLLVDSTRGGVESDYTETPPLFYTVAEYEIHTTVA